MARPSHPPLLCLDLTAEAVQATLLKGRGSPDKGPLVGEPVPAWATPVPLGDDTLGWRVGQIAYGRRLVDADRVLAHVPAALADHDTIERAARTHDDLELPLAHLLAHATRRALGEPEPSHDPEGGEAEAADDEDETAHAAEADQASASEPAVPASETEVAAETEAEPAPASPLTGCEALLLVAPALPAPAQVALVRAAEKAGLPTPGTVLRDEALAWATWRRLQAHARAQPMRAAQAATAPTQAAPAPAESQADAPELEASAADNGEAAEQSAVAVEAEAAETSTSVAEAQATEAPASATDAEAQAWPLPSTWLQVDLGHHQLAISAVQVADGRPTIHRRLQEPRASLAAVLRRTQAWGEGAWSAVHGQRALDALGQRRLAEGAARLFGRLDQQDEATLSLPAMALEQAGDAEEATLVGLDTELTREDALAWLAELSEAATHALAAFAEPTEAAPQAASGKRRRKSTAHAQAAPADAPGLLLTGNWAAWPGLRAAVTQQLPTHQLLEPPDALALAEAARALAFEAVPEAAA